MITLCILVLLIGQGEFTYPDFNQDTLQLHKLPVYEVTSTRLKEEKGESPGVITTISKDEIEFFESSLLSTLMQGLPGIFTLPTGHGGQLSTQILRGGASTGNIIYIDGYRLSTRRSGSFNLSLVPPKIISGAEIHRGGASSFYGEGPIYGVTNFLLKEEIPQFAQLSIGYGSYGYHRSSLIFNPKSQDLSIFFQYNREESDGNYPVTINDSTFKRENTGYKKESYYFHHQDRQWNQVFLLSENDAGVPGRLSQLSPSAKEFDQLLLYGIGYDGENLFTRGQVQRERISFDFSDFQGDESFNQSLVYRLASGYRYRREKFNVYTGYDGYIENVKVDTLIEKQTKGLSLVGGMNLELGPFIPFGYTSKDLLSKDAPVSPKTGIIIKGKDALSLKFIYSKSFREPSINDLYWPRQEFFWNDTVWITKGDSLLKPERTEEWNAGLEIYPRKIPLSISLSYFRTLAKNLIEWRTLSGDTTITSPRNVKRAIMTGFETELRFNKGGFIFNLFYTYLQSKDLEKETSLPLRPKHTLRTDLLLNTTFLIGGISYNYIGKRGKLNTPKGNLQPANIINALLGLHIFHYVDFKVIFENILNKNYELIDEYPLPKRTIRFELTGKLGGFF